MMTIAENATDKPNETCPSRTELRALSLGSLSENDSDQLLEHVSDCQPCQTELETLDDAEDSLISGLRVQDASQAVDSEPLCELAVAKALGALAMAHSDPQSEAASDFPRMIGEYEIVRALGQGGMGRVYLARHTKLGREVALKVVADHRLSDPRVLRRFENEMRAVGRLSHPNIVTAHDAREIDSTAVLVTEYIDGMDLGKVVSSVGQIRIADACEVTRHVALALQYTGDQGFVHRDIKPSNIMLSKSGEIKLLDLGLARLQQDDSQDGESPREMTGTGQTMGTADYVSPEQVTDSRDVDVRSDLYSLGCTLFKLLTGRPPYSSEKHSTAFAKMNAHVSEPPPKISKVRTDIPRGLSKLVDSLLQKDPAQRPQNPVDLANQLKPFCGEADLSDLINQAVSRTPIKGEANQSTTSNVVVAEATQPWWRRPVPLLVAVASGFFGGGLGVLLGILITIEFPDGTKVVTEAPEDTKVTITSTDDGGKSPKGTTSKVDRRSATNAALAKAGTVQPSSTNRDIRLSRNAGDSAANSNRQMWEAETLTFAIVTDNPSGFPDGGISLPTDDGKGFVDGDSTFVIASGRPNDRFGWLDIKEHLRGFVVNQGVEILFSKTGGEKLRALAVNSQGERLGVIANGRVIMSMQIVAEVKDRFMIAGLHPKQKTQLTSLLQRALNEKKHETTLKETASQASSSDPPTSTANTWSMQGVWELTDLSASEAYTAQASQYWFIDDDKLWMREKDGIYQEATIRYQPSEANQSDPNGVQSGVVGNNIVSVPMTRGVDLDITKADGTVLRGLMMTNQHSAMRGGPVARWVQLGFSKAPHPRPRSFVPELLEPGLEMHFSGSYLSPLPSNREEFENLSRRAKGKGQSAEIARTIVEFCVASERVPADEAAESGKQAKQRLKELALAIHNFHADHEAFPTSAERGLGESSSFSWRVAILPFIQQNALYQQYRFDEPWDSEHNSQLIAKMPDVFKSSLDRPSDKPGHTHIQSLAGDDRAMGVTKSTSFTDLTDGSSNTLLLIETTKSVPWTKPEDITGDPELADNGLIYGVMADAKPFGVLSINPDSLKKMLTRSGGETIDALP